MKQQQVVKLTNPQSKKKKTMSKTQKIYFVLVDNLFYHTSCCCPHRRSSRPGIKKEKCCLCGEHFSLFDSCVWENREKKNVSKLVRKLE